MSTEKQLNREEEERLIALSIIPLIPVMILIGVYLVDLTSRGIISYQELIGYSLALAVLVLMTGCGVYEIASSFKTKVPALFRVKRFLSRTVFFSAFMAGFYSFWVLLSLLLSSALKAEYILLLSLLAISFTASILVRNRKARRFIKKLTMEE
jgi:uncharacterized membrane protein